jgi:hypothetical protein
MLASQSVALQSLLVTSYRGSVREEEITLADVRPARYIYIHMLFLLFPSRGTCKLFASFGSVTET